MITNKLPSTIKVACYDIGIEEWDDKQSHGANRFGEFSIIEGTIRINTKTHKYKIIDTLHHEILHCIYWAYGIDEKDDEERTVAAIATAYTQVLRDNPELRKYIELSFLLKD